MEEVKYPDVSLVIQGSLKDKSVLSFKDNINYYKTLFPEIILSTWTEHLDEEIYEFCRKHDMGLAHQPLDVIGNLENRYNIAYHSYSSCLGFVNASRKYTLKHRTDEKYSNLHRLVDLFLEDDSKWVSGGTAFGQKSYYLYHAADHLFIAQTQKLIDTFIMTIENLKRGVLERNVAGEPAAEITFTKNFLKIHGEDPRPDNHDELMRKYFNFINDCNLHPFVIRINGCNYVLTEEYQFNNLFFKKLHTIDEVLSH